MNVTSRRIVLNMTCTVPVALEQRCRRSGSPMPPPQPTLMLPAIAAASLTITSSAVA